MNALGYLIIAIAKVFHLLINAYTFVVVIAVILSWLRPDPSNPIVRVIHQITEPLFFRVRRIMPSALFRTGLDFTPLVILLVLVLVDTVFVNLLYDFGRTLISSKGVM